MATQQETTKLLIELNEALEELTRLWDTAEKWSEENLEPIHQQVA